ncbi:MAG TPA: error-prone DNA polymerase [Burkholderiales bacterium]|nr:error-prone DNA polymerase [Burkholderiales bacterium]
MFPSYAELHCLTNFTFLRGASHPEELVERAAQLGYSALAITDECSLAGVVRAHVAAKERRLKLVVGAEFTLHEFSPHPSPRIESGADSLPQGERGFSARGARKKESPLSPAYGGEGKGEGNTFSHLPPLTSLSTTLRIVLLATDREGYGNLSELITRGRRQARKGEYRLTRVDLERGVPGCLALLLPAAESSLDEARWLGERFPGNAWIAAELVCGPDDRAGLDRLDRLSRDSGLPLVAAGDVHMHLRARRALQDTLTAIRLKCPVASAGHGLLPSGERHLRRRERLARIFPPELLIETLNVAERCHFSLDSLRYEYPEELVPAGETPAVWLRKLAEEGFRWRFGCELSSGAGQHESRITSHESRSFIHDSRVTNHESRPFIHEPRATNHEPWSFIHESRITSHESRPFHGWGSRFTIGQDFDIAKARALVEHELSLIAELQYEPYFLTVYDVVRFARSQGILCQGRGSAANSAVCYCLGITEVDPARMQMLFERFISKERNEPPDIDVDFEHERREEVIQYIYRKYGRDRAALAATVITYRPKSALRDVGKALGLDLAQVDRLAKGLAWWDGRRVRPERLREAGFDPDNPVIQRLIALVDIIVGFPRHLSQHVGGFVISRGPLSHLVPIENAAMDDRTVIQWDKDDLDALGLLKIDVLALGMLTAIRRALNLVSQYRGKPLSMPDVPAEDPGVYEMVGHADTIGVFQIESRAQQAMLPRMRPACFYDLVIEVAIVRPGPIQGGMVHPYLRRRAGIEPVTYPSEAVKKVLERTLGVPIFQEQVMQLAVVAAGFTPGEADRLRRAMAAWRRRGGLEPFEQRLKDGMRERGYAEAFADQIYRQILGFGEYGFPESHSASFALLVYVSCWLKRYEPAAFTCALLNSQPMGFYAPSQLVQDAQRHGVEVRPVDVLVSGWDCTLERGAGMQPAIRLGLRMVKGLPRAAADRLVEARERLWGNTNHGPFEVTNHESRATSDSLLNHGLPEVTNHEPRITNHGPLDHDLFEDLARAAALSRHDMNALAAAGALASIVGHRRQAVWTVTGVEPRPPVLEDAPILDITPPLPPPSEGQDLVADYASLGLTLGRHPVALLRPRLDRLRMVTATQLKQMPHGKLTRAAGIVIGRQRPDTASGVIFVTLEDETGMINVVVWRDVAEKQRRALLGSQLLAVHGVLERQGDVIHLIAGKLTDHSRLLGELVAHSRDFH